MRRITRVMRIRRVRAAPWPAASSPINDAMPRDVVPAAPRARLARVFRVGLGLLRRGALGLLHDPLDRLLIAARVLGRPRGPDEQDGALLGREAADEILRLFIEGQGLFEIDDVDLVAVPEDVGGHLGMPVTGLMTEVDARLEHLTHGNIGHKKLLNGVEPPYTPCTNPPCGHPDACAGVCVSYALGRNELRTSRR